MTDYYQINRLFLYAFKRSAEQFCRTLGVLQNSAELPFQVPQTSAEWISDVMFPREVLQNSS